jgi:formiminotetrahydrofolate cyclodeaminase
MDQRAMECVPNFSEGRERTRIKQITDAVQAAWSVARDCDVNSITDAAVGADCLQRRAGRRLERPITLKGISDLAFVREMRAKCDTLVWDTQKLLVQVTTHTDTRLSELNERKN